MLGWNFNDGLNLIQQHHIKWVQSVSAGVDYFPLEEFEKNNVILTSASGLNSQRVANFVLLQCLSDSYSINETYINGIYMIFEEKYYYFWNGKYREKYFRGFKSFCEKYLWGKYFREKK